MLSVQMNEAKKYNKPKKRVRPRSAISMLEPKQWLLRARS